MNLIERAKSILLTPKEAWPVIDAEPATVASIYKDWLVIMAAIPAVCGFIGMSFVGVGMFGYGYKVPIIGGLVTMVFGYVLSLVMAYVMALVVDALAPNFGATKNPVGAMKVMAYGATAVYVAGLFKLIPMLGMLGILAACYSVYLMYLGLQSVMKCPQDKAAGYTAVVVIIYIVVAIIVGTVSALFMGFGALAGGYGRSGGSFSLKTPDGEVNVDSGAMAAAAARMDAARAKMEAAQKSGDPASAAAAAGDVLGALTGAGGTPIPVADLKAQLPEALGALKRESLETSGGSAMGISSSVAKAGYVAGEQRAQLTISDMGGLGALASVATWANVTVDKETPDGIEKTYKDSGRTVHEQYRKDGSHSEYTVVLKNGVIVETSGDKVDGATLKSMASGVNLDALEAMKRPAKS
ncbi:MAG: Yip1 family protein [Burkholderiaceae bacterium]